MCPVSASLRLLACRLVAAVILVQGIFSCGSDGVAAAQAVSIGPVLGAVVGNRLPGYSGDGGPADSAELSSPFAIVFDSAGNMYVADTGNNVVRRVNPAGVITTIAGNRIAGFSGDGGAATSAELNGPQSIALDRAGNLYIADGSNQRIRKVAAATGVITTVAGNGMQGFSGDGGPATQAEIFNPFGIAIDGAGNLYIADDFNNRVRKVAATTGIITTVAGTGTRGNSGDEGPATDAEIAPISVAVNAGNLYIGNSNDGDSTISEDSIRKVSLTSGIITTVAGNGNSGSSGDGGPATSAELWGPWGLAFDKAGNLYIADANNNRVRTVSTATGIITTVTGNGPAFNSRSYSSFSDGTLTGSELNEPFGLAFDGAGNLFIADTNNQVVREMRPAPPTLIFPTVPSSSPPVILPLEINADGTSITSISVPASMGNHQEYIVTDTGGCALNTELSAGTICDLSVTFHPNYPGARPASLQVNTSAGTFHFGMLGTGQASLIALAPGIIGAVAGTGERGFSGDGGPARSATFFNPADLALDSAGNLYIVDSGNSQIRRVDAATGTIRSIAGSGATNSPSLSSPSGIALDAAGNLYIADSGNNVIRELSADTGMFTIVAGNGAPGFSGDNAAATVAQLKDPTSIAIDPAHNLYVADTGNFRIRKISADTGVITTIAGSGNQGFSGDGGLATSADLYSPQSLALDSSNNLYFTDAAAANSPGAQVRMISAETGVISRFAGTGNPGYSGDGGPAADADLNGPSDIAVDSVGDLYIADNGNHLIREVTAATGIIITVAGNGTLGSSGDNGVANAAEFSPQSIALDSAGNIYISDSYQGSVSYNSVRKIDVSRSQLNFGSPTANTVSADSPKSVVVTNIGNAELNFTTPHTGVNPAISNPDFQFFGKTTCPLVDTAMGVYLNPGASCIYSVQFKPAAKGAVTGTATISNNTYIDNTFTPIVQTHVIELTGGSGTVGGGNSGPPGDFTVSANPSVQKLAQDSTAVYAISIQSKDGFFGPVALSVAGVPSGSTYSLTPGDVNVSANGTSSATLTVISPSVRARGTEQRRPFPGKQAPSQVALLLPVSLLGISGLRKRLRGFARAVFLPTVILISMGAIFGMNGCADVGLEANNQTYTMTVTGVSGGLQHSMNVTLTMENVTPVSYGRIGKR